MKPRVHESLRCGSASFQARRCTADERGSAAIELVLLVPALMLLLLFAVAGIVYQLFVRLSPEERARLKEEKRKAKKRRDETKAVESRWSGYSKNKGGVDA
mgnify:CR=1 FL=1